MIDPIDPERIRAAIELLEDVSPDARLISIAKLCLNNGGRWDDRILLLDEVAPCLFEIQLFGVPAMAETREDIPANWIRAATNVLKFSDEIQGEAA